MITPRKKLIIAVLAAAMQLTALPVWAGEGATESRILTVTGSVVNVRKGPDVEFERLGQVKKGDVLSVREEKNGWYLVEIPKIGQAWIAGWLVRTEGSLVPAAAKMVTVSGSVVNIRQGPSLEARVIGKVYRGQHMSVTGLQGDWYKVKIGAGKEGWIATWLTEPLNNSIPARGGSSSPIVPGSLKGRVIVIDPGHATERGGIHLDPGAIGPRTGLYEREVNMSITAKLKRMLEDAGAKVILTHSGGTGLSLAGRAGLADKTGADIFVSIHANSSTNRNLAGHTTYFYAPWSDTYLRNQRDRREKLAALVQRELVKAGGRRDMGIREANYAVLRETRVPSILVETAYLSHPEEEILLGQDSYRELLARGIFKGIQAYFK